MGAATLTTLVDGTVPSATSFNANFTAINNAIWPVNQGGTGTTVYAVGDMLIGTGATALSKLAAASTNFMLMAAGTTTAPTWSNQLLLSGTQHVFGGSTVGVRYMVDITGAYSVGTTLAGAGLRVGANLTPATSSNGFLLDISGALTKAGAGTHSIFAGLAIQIIAVTAGAASLTNTASLYIAGSMPATVVNTNYGMWVDDGTVRLDALLDARAGATFSGTVTAAGLTMSGTTALVPASAPASPVAGALYADNLVKAWLRAGLTGNILANFGISSLTDVGAGVLSIAWANAFATNTSYALMVMIQAASGTTVQAAGTTTTTTACTVFCATPAGTLTDPVQWHVIAIGT